LERKFHANCVVIDRCWHGTGANWAILVEREASFESLVSSQNDIGWSHWLHGRFSRHWVQIQQAHINIDEKISSQKSTGSRWHVQKGLNPLCMHLCLTWKSRNADRHGVDKADQESKYKAKLKPAIVALCKIAACLGCLDKRMIALPVDDRLLHS
jgi:hypothetical protein